MPYYSADDLARHIEAYGKMSRSAAAYHKLLTDNAGRIVTFETIMSTLRDSTGIEPTKLSLRTMSSRLRPGFKRMGYELRSHYDLGYELVKVAAFETKVVGSGEDAITYLFRTP